MQQYLCFLLGKHSASVQHRKRRVCFSWPRAVALASGIPRYIIYMLVCKVSDHSLLRPLYKYLLQPLYKFFPLSPISHFPETQTTTFRLPAHLCTSNGKSMDDSIHGPSRPECSTEPCMLPRHVLKYSPCCLVFQIPPTPEHPGPTFQPNIPMYQQNEYPSFQNCHCAQCSSMRRAEGEPPNWYPAEQQDLRYSGVGGLCDDDGISHLIALSL